MNQWIRTPWGQVDTTQLSANDRQVLRDQIMFSRAVAAGWIDEMHHIELEQRPEDELEATMPARFGAEQLPSQIQSLQDQARHALQSIEEFAANAQVASA